LFSTNCGGGSAPTINPMTTQHSVISVDSGTSVRGSDKAYGVVGTYNINWCFYSVLQDWMDYNIFQLKSNLTVTLLFNNLIA
jgi:hypothetical protein